LSHHFSLLIASVCKQHYLGNWSFEIGEQITQRFCKQNTALHFGTLSLLLLLLQKSAHSSTQKQKVVALISLSSDL
jgi:hypothetical protein